MDGQAVVEQIVLGRPVPELPVKLIVLLPAEVWLPAHVALIAASGETATARFTRCVQLCVADIDADAALLTPSRRRPSRPSRFSRTATAGPSSSPSPSTASPQL
ncbi:MAG TPA: invasion associated locus B family protein [Pelagibacterium sp.]|uniref:invasion associated locus B family protein n=1 Tax=Pelagibacterium sp. TaxID=1967288 RepID=UPI002D095F36|nr:invasion associated locus B family protein [Pelagibacterium sp.]HWJ87907.1 invasion associated locus B family protein [Pelagibacterium sp.]